MSDNDTLSKEEQVKQANRGFVNLLDETTNGQLEKASAMATDYTEMKQREDGIWRRVMTMNTISTDQLSRTFGPYSEQLVFVADGEPESPASISVPLGKRPVEINLYGNRYPVLFDWIQTKKMRKNVIELATYTADLRQIVSDNAIKDMLAEQDAKGIASLDAAVGTVGVNNPLTGVIQNAQISGGITRNTWKQAMQLAKSTPANIRPAIALMNHVTLEELFELDHDVVGPDLVQESFQTGVSVFTQVSGVKLVVTIKRDLVDDDVTYFIASEDYLGKFLCLSDTVMSIKREDQMIYMYAYGCYGSAIGNVAAVVKVEFTA